MKRRTFRRTGIYDSGSDSSGSDSSGSDSSAASPFRPKSSPLHRAVPTGAVQKGRRRPVPQAKRRSGIVCMMPSRSAGMDKDASDSDEGDILLNPLD